MTKGGNNAFQFTRDYCCAPERDLLLWLDFTSRQTLIPIPNYTAIESNFLGDNIFFRLAQQETIKVSILGCSARAAQEHTAKTVFKDSHSHSQMADFFAQ